MEILCSDDKITSNKMTHHRQPQHQHHLFPQSYGFEDTADQQGDGGYYAGEGGPGPSTFISTTPISPPGSQGYQHPQGIIISKFVTSFQAWSTRASVA